MGTFVINSEAPVEIIAAAGVDYIQVVTGAARVAELADPIGGLHLESGAEILFFDGLTGAVNAIAATPGGSATIRTGGANPTIATTAADTGVWTGGIPVANIGAMPGVTADPTSIWAEGKFAILGDGSNTHWDGTAWQAGAAPLPPLATGATAGIAGVWTPAGSTVPQDLAAVIAAAVIANPLTLWTVGQSVVTADTNDIHWDGAAWVTDVAPA